MNCVREVEKLGPCPLIPPRKYSFFIFSVPTSSIFMTLNKYIALDTVARTHQETLPLSYCLIM